METWRRCHTLCFQECRSRKTENNCLRNRSSMLFLACAAKSQFHAFLACAASLALPAVMHSLGFTVATGNNCTRPSLFVLRTTSNIMMSCVKGLTLPDRKSSGGAQAPALEQFCRPPKQEKFHEKLASQRAPKAARQTGPFPRPRCRDCTFSKEFSLATFMLGLICSPVFWTLVFLKSLPFS